MSIPFAEPIAKTDLAGGCDLSCLDEVAETFMTERRIPGGAVAVSKDRRLVFARGYGIADSAGSGVKPTSLFRIASVSKPLCSAAVMRLVQEGRLGLHDKVYDLLGLQTPIETGALDPRQIDILHLLQHQGGYDRGVSFDPHSIDRAVAAFVGKPLPVTRWDIVDYVIGRPLDFAPGTRYAYSNFGYQLLGHVVEKLTGMEFTAYVKEAVLQPLGIWRPTQGFSSQERRQEGEVEYFTSNPNFFGCVLQEENVDDTPFPYGGYNLENMVSSGGWIASAPDLVRFASAFDAPEDCPILRRPYVEALFAPPQANRWSESSYYACGWAVQQRGDRSEASHGGCLQGVTSSLRRRADGVCFCALFNRREETTPFSWDIDGALNAAIDRIDPDEWPREDLFESALG